MRAPPRRLFPACYSIYVYVLFGCHCGKANPLPSALAGYKVHIKNHIVPFIGHAQLRRLFPATLHNTSEQLFN